jgi:hypothetical protein
VPKTAEAILKIRMWLMSEVSLHCVEEPKACQIIDGVSASFTETVQTVQRVSEGRLFGAETRRDVALRDVPLPKPYVVEYRPRPQGEQEK